MAIDLPSLSPSQSSSELHQRPEVEESSLKELAVHIRLAPEPTLASSSPVAASPLVHGNGPAEWSRSHDSLKETPDLWGSLAFDGLQSNGRGGLIELRRCPTCGSTIARPISKADAEALLGHVARIYAQSLASLQAA